MRKRIEEPFGEAKEFTGLRRAKFKVAPNCSRADNYGDNRPEHKEDGKAPAMEGTKERERGDGAAIACPLLAFPVSPRKAQ
jgi:hypothetical protein